MPKMKTHRGAAKRFRILPSGKIRRDGAFDNHIFEKKSPTRKRRLEQDKLVSQNDEKRIRRLLGK